MPRSPAVVLALLLAATARADTSPALILRPERPGADDALALEVRTYLDGRTDAGNAFAMSWVTSRGRFPLSGPGAERRIVLGYEVDHLNLDSRDPRVPSHVTDTSVGVGLDLGSAWDWDWKTTLGIGHASTEPFADRRGWYGIGMLGAVRRLDEQTRISVLVSYDGSRGFLPHWPLPGFQYERFVSPALRFVVGLPINYLVWKPAERWEIEAAFLLPYRGRLGARYALTEQASAYLAFRQQRLRAHVKGDPHDVRLGLEEYRLELGLEWRPRNGFLLALAGGYAFGRDFRRRTEAGSEFDGFSLSDEPYLALRLDWTF